MANRKHVGTFHSVDTVLHKITELGALGYTKYQIYGVSGIDDSLAMLKGKTEIGLQGGNGEKSILEAFTNMGFSEQQAEAYFHEVKDGGVALFVEDKQLHSNDVNVLMDSAAERGLSGEQLDGQDEYQQTIDHEKTVPRINTRNL